MEPSRDRRISRRQTAANLPAAARPRERGQSGSSAIEGRNPATRGPGRVPPPRYSGSRRDISSASAGQGSRRQTAANLPAAVRPRERGQSGSSAIEGRNPATRGPGRVPPPRYSGSRRDISSASAGQGSRRQTAANLPAAARPRERGQSGSSAIEGRNPATRGPGRVPPPRYSGSRRDISSASAGQGSRRQTAANLPAAARPPESDQGGAETIEGRNPVLEALRAGRPINKIPPGHQ